MLLSPQSILGTQLQEFGVHETIILVLTSGLDPLALEHVSEYVVSANGKTDLSPLLTISESLHPFEAVQEVAFNTVQERSEESPLFIEDGETLRVTIGTAQNEA